MQIYLVVMKLIVLAIFCMAETEENDPCFEAMTNYIFIDSSLDSESIFQLYLRFLGACYNKDWEECSAAENEYDKKTRQSFGAGEDQSCDQLMEKMRKLRKEKWLYDVGPLEATPGVKK